MHNHKTTKAVDDAYAERAVLSEAHEISLSFDEARVASDEELYLRFTAFGESYWLTAKTGFPEWTYSPLVQLYRTYCGEYDSTHPGRLTEVSVPARLNLAEGTVHAVGGTLGTLVPVDEAPATIRNAPAVTDDAVSDRFLRQFAYFYDENSTLRDWHYIGTETTVHESDDADTFRLTTYLGTRPLTFDIPLPDVTEIDRSPVRTFVDEYGHGAPSGLDGEDVHLIPVTDGESAFPSPAEVIAADSMGDFELVIPRSTPYSDQSSTAGSVNPPYADLIVAGAMVVLVVGLLSGSTGLTLALLCLAGGVLAFLLSRG